MARTYSDDLRIRVSEADERGEGGYRVLAKRFGVSREYVRKVRRQREENQSALRRPQSRFGPASRLNEGLKAYILAQFREQPDLTIAELQDKIVTEQKVSAGWTTVHRWVGQVELRLKKSRSTPRNGTAKPIDSRGSGSSSASAKHQRRS